MNSRIDPNSLAIDSNALNGLKRSAQADSPDTIRAAAKQFEGVLMQMMLKSMRDTVPQDGAFDNEQSRMFSGMLDQQLSTQLSQKGLGLSDLLVKQLTKSPAAQAGFTTSTPASTPSNAAAGSTPAPMTSSLSGSSVYGANLTGGFTPSGQHTRQRMVQLMQQTADNLSGVTLPANAMVGTLSQWTQSALLAQNSAMSAATTQVSGLQQSNGVLSKTAQFIQSMLPHAQSASASSGIPARFMVGQAALESGWGKHEIKTSDGQPSYNLFGIKADASWTGKVATTVTTEYVHGVKQQRTEQFRAYESYSDAFADYARLISQNPRYQNAMQQTHNAGAYAQALQQAGYATDPLYGHKLSRVIAQISV